MTADEFAELGAGFERTLYALDKAIMSYGEDPSPQLAHAVAEAAARYEELSVTLGERLFQQLQSEDRDAAATRLVALVGLDVGVAIQAGEVGAIIGEPAEDDEATEPRGVPREVLEQMPVRCTHLARDLIFAIRFGRDPSEASSDEPEPEGRGNPSFTVADEVDAIVKRAAADMTAVATRAVLSDVLTLGHAAITLLPGALQSLLQDLSHQLDKWSQVCRRLAVRGWRWVMSKVTALVGGAGAVGHVGGVLQVFLPNVASHKAAAVLGSFLGKADVTATCDALVNRDERKAAHGIKAAKKAVKKHKSTRKGIGWAAKGLGVLAPLSVAGVPMSVLGAIVLLLLSYVLAHDFLDSKSPPPLPGPFEGIRRKIEKAV
jgi:hypothetical protein